jgi:hypothetical protein
MDILGKRVDDSRYAVRLVLEFIKIKSEMSDSVLTVCSQSCNVARYVTV